MELTEKEKELALEIAETLDDMKSLYTFQKQVKKYSESFLREQLAKAMEKPKKKYERIERPYTCTWSINKTMPRKTILGLSPGMHTIGMAVMKESELVEYRMKVFNESWSEMKVEKMISVIQKMAKKYEVTIIALKILHPKRSSPGLDQLISAISALTKSQGIALYSCTMSDIKRHCSEERRCNKGVVVEYVLQKHPELHREYQREQGNRNPYYIKVLEAIALARLCIKNMEHTNS